MHIQVNALDDINFAVALAHTAQSDLTHVSTARPPEGTDASPLGAVNAVSVGAYSY